jgi:undecaprenyl diphosphate synthase
MGRLNPENIPHHVAIIPDGNGRWAVERGLPRAVGHQRGTEAVRAVVRAAHELGVRTLTFYAFSRDNWGRPAEEIDAIMSLLVRYIREEGEELLRNGIRVEAIGRLEELDLSVREAVADLCRRTENNDEMLLCFAISYSGRAEIVDAVRRIARAVEAGLVEPDAIDEKTLQDHLYAPELSSPDLLIRTGDEFRVSNFVLWQLSYTELYFTPLYWPDFTKGALVDAIAHYQSRERRFGRTSAQVRADRGP